MPLRIAFDLDGVLADMDSELVRQAELLFGEAMTHRLLKRAMAPGETKAPTSAEPDNTAEDDAALDTTPPLLKLNMTARQQRKLWKHVESIENFWETLKEIEPGAISRLSAMVAARRWEIIFLTTRPQTAGATAQVQTQRWLESHGFNLPSVFVVHGSRGRVAAALGIDLVIDDRPENCLDVVVDSKARAILVWRDDAKLLPSATRRLGIGSVRSVDECLNILSEIDSTSPPRSGVFDRVLRLLGLKEKALEA